MQFENRDQNKIKQDDPQYKELIKTISEIRDALKVGAKAPAALTEEVHMKLQGIEFMYGRVQAFGNQNALDLLRFELYYLMIRAGLPPPRAMMPAMWRRDP